MKDETLLLIVAISGIVALEALALLCGINGSLLSMVIGTISGIVGYEYRKRKEN